jgi:DNA-binding response OmpR family regulator
VARVLIAADAPMVRAILAHKLRREGHDVTTVSSGAAARAAQREAGFDCALLDTPLHEIDPGGVHPVWLAIVDSRDAAAGDAAMRAGAAGLVTLPFKPTDVAAQVTALLELQRLVRR